MNVNNKNSLLYKISTLLFSIIGIILSVALILHHHSKEASYLIGILFICFGLINIINGFLDPKNKDSKVICIIRLVFGVVGIIAGMCYL